MRYRKCRRLKAEETEKTERRHGEGGGYGDDLDDGIAAKRGQSVATHRIIDRGVRNMDIARRPAPDPGGVSVDRARGRQILRVAFGSLDRGGSRIAQYSARASWMPVEIKCCWSDQPRKFEHAEHEN